jgi:cytochrome c553
MENIMMSRRSAAGAALIATVCGLALVVQVQASADKVAFPENYAKGVRWLVVDKVEAKQVHELYAMPDAIEAARKDQPMPNGTVFTVVQYSAQLDAQGNPVKGADGRLVKGEIRGFNAMEKRTGWGSEYPDTLRNGEWEYRAFTADKKPNENAKLTACFECHKPLANQDFVHAYDKLKEAAR